MAKKSHSRKKITLPNMPDREVPFGELIERFMKVKVEEKPKKKKK